MFYMIFLLEYIWIDGFGNLRSKTKVHQMKELDKSSNVNLLPEWNYDGSSTGQATGDDSEVIIRPVAFYEDPFRGENNFLVLCDTWLPNGEPHPTNTRASAVEVFKLNAQHDPMYGIEQEFFIVKDGKPIGFPGTNFPRPQQDYYCGIGGDNVVGREFIEESFRNCLTAGLSLTGLNAEVAPSQWEFQVCDMGIKAADQLYMMRYILDRTAEKYGWSVNYHPKPVMGDWNGSGCHTNFSTKAMRAKGGYPVILDAIKKLGHRHMQHMENYGKDNHLRMSGKHETARYDHFSYGVADRGSSIRIPRTTERDECGYFEDRRPASNMDPYVVTSMILDTVTSEHE